VTSATIPDNFDPDRTRTHGGDPPGDPPGADVEITNVISRPVDVDSLALFEYLYIVTNNGPDLAPGVVLTDLYDSGVRVAFPDAICVLLPGAQDAVTCDIGNLAPGFSAIVSVITRAPMVATVTVVEDFARVKHDGKDTKPVNNIRAERTRINPPPPPPPAGSADLAVVKRALWDPVVPGTGIHYSLTVFNSGPTTATGITLTDVLPAGATFQSTVSEPEEACLEFEATVSCVFPSLASGDFLEVEVIATAPIASGEILNAAAVTANEADPDLANNEAFFTTLIEDRRAVPEPNSDWLAIAALVTIALVARGAQSMRGRPHLATSVEIED